MVGEQKTLGRAAAVLLKRAKEEGLVLPNQPSHREAIHISAENGLRRVVQLIKVGNRVEALRLVPPQQRPMHAIRAGFRDDVKPPAGGTSKLHAEVACLYRDLLDRIGDVERLRDASQREFIIVGAVQKIVIRAKTLAVHREGGFRSASI